MSLSVDQALRKAGRHARKGELELAARLYEGVIERFPGNRRAAEGLKALRAQPSAGALPSPAPDGADAHYNLGNRLWQRGRPEEAAAAYAEALRIRPGDADALNNLGGVLYHLGRLEEAAARYTEALRVRPDDADAQYNLGNALRRLGRPREATAAYAEAVRLRPAHADAHGNLGVALAALGRHGEAIASLRRAIALAPEREEYWQGLASALDSAKFATWDAELAELFCRLLARPASVRPDRIGRPLAQFLKLHPGLARHLQDVPGDIGADEAAALGRELADIPLFLLLIELCPVPDREIEALLRALRRSLLLHRDAVADGPGLPAFRVSLALQGFTNEYVFGETQEETTAVGALEAEIEAALAGGEVPDEGRIACLASYRPLYLYGWARKMDAPEALAPLFRRQIAEVAEEDAIRADIPRLRPVADAVSSSVRRQYEENPYPRWIATRLPARPSTLAAVADQLGLRLTTDPAPLPDRPDILVAGCGTGQQSLATARRFANCRVLAVDLSLSSLAYAIRRTRALGVANIEHMQADILDLGALGRRFDVVESVGVLHHMADPAAGWKVLTECLKPGGLMRIGLYSELARRPVVRARERIAALGLSDATGDILKFRQEILASDDEELSRITGSSDFYSTSALRDLLFHVQERRFSLPEIGAMLDSLGLSFCGFDLSDARILTAFRQDHAEPEALFDLAAWHAFETAHPDAFAGMYQFWVQKRSGREGP